MKSYHRYFVLITVLMMAIIVMAGCGGSTEKPVEGEQQPETEAPKVVSLVEQVKASGHYGFFKEMADNGEYPPERADACIECHSAVKIVDDHEAKFADFQPGGKYEGETEGISCRVCHEMGGEEMFTLRNEGLESCGVCHTAEGIEEGKEVHHSQLEMVKGIEGIGVDDKPSRKMEQDFACFDCHFTNQLDHDFKSPTAAEIAANEKCSGCHADAAKLEADMKAQVDKVKAKIEELKPRLESAQKALEDAKTAGKDVTDAEKALGPAITDLTYVEADASFGIHNPEYADSLLKVTAEKLDEFDSLMK